MKKYLLTLLTFCVIVGSVLTLCLTLNNGMARAWNGQSVPQEIADGPCAIDGLYYDESAGGYPLILSGITAEQPLCITIYFRIMEVWQDGTCLAAITRESESQRVVTVPVQPDEEGNLRLLIKTQRGSITPGLKGYSLKTLFTPYSQQRPKVVLSSVESADRLSALGNGFYYALIGCYLMLMAACVIMFRRKPTERYLLTVCVAAFFVLLYLLTAIEDGVIRFSYSAVSELSTLTNMLPVICLAYTCVGLYPEDLPPRWKRAFSLPVFVGVAVACVAAEVLTKVYLYQFLRRLALLPVLCTMACALQHKRRGSRLIFSAYAVMEGIALFLYVSNCILDAPYAPLLMFVRIKELSNLIFLAACAVVIFDRFSTKFLEADALNEEVQAMNAALEQKVQERTAQLVQEQERKHNMMLNIFHDLRNPVFVLKGRLASMHPQGTEEQEAVHVMTNRVKYLDKLINDLFLSAKLESGDVQYDQDAVDLNDLCKTVLHDLGADAKEKGVTLCGDLCDESAVTWGDGWRLQQALVNLVDNAIVYTPAGGRVTLSLRVAKGRCMVEVADTGRGIPKEELPLVFERYYRASQRDHRSTGLGLSIVREIVRAHRGNVYADSEVGRGSRFVMELPQWNE